MGSLGQQIPHVVVFPYPAQGHMNPLMEFAKRLLCRNLHVTFITTERVRERMVKAQEGSAAHVTTALQDIRIETISDGLSPDLEKTKDVEKIFDLFRKVGGLSFEKVIESLNSQGERVSCIVYDALVEWVPHVARKFIPSIITSTKEWATWILGNSFDELETAERESMDSLIPIRTVGPLVPSAFLDGNNPQDQDVGTHLWKTANCMDWLNTKEASTVVYVSFGSLTVLSKEQIIEIAHGLKASKHSFLWVIRPDDNKEESNDVDDFLEGFVEETKYQGLVVSWCPQMAVLNHPSVGMFFTHCGWNSTLESLSSGLPVLTFSQWSDQTTNSKYIEDVWKTGIRLNKLGLGLVGRDGVQKSIKIVMESDEGLEFRKNALQ